MNKVFVHIVNDPYIEDSKLIYYAGDAYSTLFRYIQFLSFYWQTTTHALKTVSRKRMVALRRVIVCVRSYDKKPLQLVRG